MEVATSYLTLDSITKAFGENKVLNGVDLNIKEGEFICILGPSGCGKTTLLRAIAGLDQQDSGKVFIQDDDVSHLPVSLRNCGIVFQSYALFPNLSVSQNIEYGMAKIPKAERAKQVSDLLELVGLGQIGSKMPAELSGGMQQRVAVARALAMSPRLLLLDEPLSALDALVRLRLRREIRSLQKKLSITTIMVTHDQDEALSIADRVILMNAGKVEQLSSPRELYAQPLTKTVASFIGAINYLDGWSYTGNGSFHYGKAKIQLDADTHSFDSLKRDIVQYTMAIRPEFITISTASSSGEPVANQLVATVTEYEYRGATTRLWVTISVPDTDEVFQLELEHFSDSLTDYCKRGKQITLHLNQEHIIVFEGENNITALK